MPLARASQAVFQTASASIAATIIAPRLHHVRSQFVAPAATTTVLSLLRVQSHCVASIAQTTARNELLAHVDRSHLGLPAGQKGAALKAMPAVAKELIAATWSNDSTTLAASSLIVLSCKCGELSNHDREEVVGHARKSIYPA